MFNASRKNLQQLFITGFLIATIYGSLFPLLNTPLSASVDVSTTESSPITPRNSANPVTDVISGTGSNQTMRIDLQSSSSSQGIDAINITSASDEEYLSYGQFNLTLPQTRTAATVFEDDTSLENPQNKTGLWWSKIHLNTGTKTNTDTESAILTDTSNLDHMAYQAVGNTLVLNQSSFYKPWLGVSSVIGFLDNVRFAVSANVLLNISIYDHVSEEWDLMIQNYKLNKTSLIS